MQIISSIEKLRLLKDDVFDLRNADLKEIADATDLMNLVNEKSANLKISMSTKDILKLILNTHKKLLFTEFDRLFLINQETLCKLIMEIDDFKNHVVDEAWEKIVAKAETAETADMTKEQRISAMRSKIILLEEKIHSMKLKKTFILPTDELYRTKREYDALREQLQLANVEKNKLREQLADAEKLSGSQQISIFSLERKLKEKENEIESLRHYYKTNAAKK